MTVTTYDFNNFESFIQGHHLEYNNHPSFQVFTQTERKPFNQMSQGDFKQKY